MLGIPETQELNKSGEPEVGESQGGALPPLILVPKPPQGTNISVSNPELGTRLHCAFTCPNK